MILSSKTDRSLGEIKSHLCACVYT